MTRLDIEKVHEMTAELEAAKVKASDLLKDAQDRHGTRRQTLSRGGKQQLIEEKALWDEVLHLGPACQSGKVLRQAHPDVFDAHEDVERKAKDLREFAVAGLGVDYQRMTLSDYLKLAEGLFAVMLSEKK